MDAQGRLTRREIIEKVKGGESVIFHSLDGNETRHISTLAEVPSAAEFARGDEVGQAVEAEELRQQIEELQKQLHDVETANDDSPKLDRLSKAKLLALATDKGITFTGDVTKAQIIEALNAPEE